MHVPGQFGESRKLVQALSDACAWINRSIVESKSGNPISIGQLPSLLSLPVNTWLPQGLERPLLEDGVLSIECVELAEAAGKDPVQEHEQALMLQVMEYLRASETPDERYCAFRRALIQAPTIRELQAIKLAVSGGLAALDLFTKFAHHDLFEVDGKTRFYPCPLCEYPMRIRIIKSRATARSKSRMDFVCCASVRCRAAGADFQLFPDGSLLALGNLACPDAVSPGGMLKLKQGLWRYTLLPGQVELELAEQLKSVNANRSSEKKIQVLLWPQLDLYDLDVRVAGRVWRVDVKDYSLPYFLAKRLDENVDRKLVSHKLSIVIPNDKSWQVDELKRFCVQQEFYEFFTVDSFIQRVTANV